MNKLAGIYVHIPFCIKKCPYCNFYSITDQSLKQPFIEALIQEMQMASSPSLLFDTLYFGGGTPSVLRPENIGRIIENAYGLFNISTDSEVTIEVNPGTVTSEQLPEYKNIGINRINIGAQSFNDEILDFLGRIHSSNDAELTIRGARKAGFDNIGIDLIYGIPGQTKEMWLSDLHRAVEFKPEHLSCYMLTYEKGTPLDIDRRQGKVKPVADSLSADLFETTMEYLSAHGYVQYEISNFAKNASRISRHNMKYWSFSPYLGFGPSAHSFTGHQRYWNCRSVKKYIENIKEGRLPVEEKEILSKEQRMMEMVYLGLRKTDGIDIDVIDETLGINFRQMFAEKIKQLEEDGYILPIQPKNRCALSRKGMLFLDSIAPILMIDD
ncbi:MAG: radical SAM family heme chaperone HemW [Proteobacteria bacterium]|nr:radical SAM family heme chaperone HemW [Desulfobacteraceae bacterium]MBU3980851.1 radical SAM family heme chaperone HemW [Pseudomonadota bacterium]MBU4100708.1 radical SAM family heme chaperone HemW [Pseudomonadota bacterium]MBU4127133.1 radical SAM family heme chaperone HemW [Pseudomonadota bacterium]MBU4419762.1 radical SAM family heme chaperone HemW [Pseudomonadota bacterium]